MIRKIFFMFHLVIMLSAYVFAEDRVPNKIFEKVISTYKSMQTYKAQGTIISDIDTDGMKMSTQTEFSITLKKPNLYRIFWTQKNMSISGMVQSGAVWSDGTQPYLYMGVMNAYSKMANDELALSGATGISGGVAFTIPSFFLLAFKEQPAPFSRLIDPNIENTDRVEGEECYIISGSSTISKKETYWISKTRHIIIKYSHSFEPSSGGSTIPEITDEQLEKTIRSMGQEVTEENKQKMRDMMKASKDILKTVNMKGYSTEIHVQISFPELSKADFQFILPEGTVFKESLFSGVFGSNE